MVARISKLISSLLVLNTERERAGTNFARRPIGA